MQITSDGVHHPARVDRTKTVPLVERVGVGRSEEEAAQVLQVWMGENRFDQPLPKPTAAVLRQHEHIGQIGDRCAVGHDPREPDLTVAVV